MADLKSLCEELNLKNVGTYIQSGNLVFNSNKQNSEIENILEEAITDKFGFDVPVIVRSSEELQTSIDNNPFFETDAAIDQLHLTFLKEKPGQEYKEKILTFKFDDKFKISDKDVFLFCTGKYHQSKLTNNFLEKKLHTVATTRNWKTVLKLYELSKN